MEMEGRWGLFSSRLHLEAASGSGIEGQVPYLTYYYAVTLPAVVVPPKTLQVSSFNSQRTKRGREEELFPEPREGKWRERPTDLRHVSCFRSLR